MGRGVRFGVFDLDLTTRELRKCGIRVRLPRQSVEVLCLLVDRPGEVISRDEIQSRLWPHGEVVEFEHGINVAVRRLREVLGESASTPHIVETIPGRGYRLLVPVNPLGTENPPPVVGVPEKPPRPAKSARRPIVTATLVATPVGLVALLLVTIPVLSDRTARESWVAEERLSTPLFSQLPEQMFPAWSPDGRFLAYIGGSGPVDRQLMVQAVGSLAPYKPDKGELVPAERQFPFWSADSKSVYFFSRLKDGPALYRVPVSGGKPELVRERTVAAAASPDGKSLAALSFSADGLWRIWVASLPDGQWAPYDPAPFAAAAILQWPNLSFSPDHSSLLAVVNLPAAGPSYFVLPWPRGTARVVFQAGLGTGRIPRVHWLPDSRHVAFLNRGELFIGDTGTDRFWRAATVDGRAGHSAPSPDGTRLAYQLSLSHTDVISVPLDGGDPRTVLGSQRSEEQAACSAAAEQLVYLTDLRDRWEVWISGLDGRWQRPVSSNDTGLRYPPPVAGAPVISRDGHRIAYRAGLSATLSGIVVIPVSGGGKPDVVVRAPVALAPSWSPDSQWIAYLELVGSTYRLMKVRSVAEQTPVELAVSYRSLAQAPAETPEWSPAGDWIAYTGESGSIALISPDGRRRKVLGSSGPVTWSADGRTLYQVRFPERALFAIDVSTGRSRRVRELGSLLPYASREPARRISLTPDGKSLVYSVLRPREEIWLRDGIRRNHSILSALANWLSRPGT